MSMVIDGAWLGNDGTKRTLVFIDPSKEMYFHNIPYSILKYPGIKEWVNEARQVLHKEMTQW